jgi:hypothetical protein
MGIAPIENQKLISTCQVTDIPKLSAYEEVTIQTVFSSWRTRFMYVALGISKHFIFKQLILLFNALMYKLATCRPMTYDILLAIGF